MPQEPNVFISWSGDRSKLIAQKLRDWMPKVVQSALPWMSEEDIEKGSRSIPEITKALGSATVGVVCLTLENLDRPWLLFEAGTLSKAVGDSAHVCTYLLDELKPEDVRPPLGMFQASRATKEDTRRLVKTIAINVANQLQGDDLDEVFDALWPSLHQTIQAAPAVTPTKQAKRSLEDMVGEILEIVRAGKTSEGSRLQQTATPLAGIVPKQIDEIIEAVRQQQKFLAELIEHASPWSLNGSVLTLHYSKDKRPFAEIVTGKESLARIRAAASVVLGRTIEIATAVADK